VGERLHRSPFVILEEYGLVALLLGSGRASGLPSGSVGERLHRSPVVILQEYGLVLFPSWNQLEHLILQTLSVQFSSVQFSCSIVLLFSSRNQLEHLIL